MTTNVLLVEQSFGYTTKALHEFILYLFDNYANLLEKQYGRYLAEVRGYSQFSHAPT